MVYEYKMTTSFKIIYITFGIKKNILIKLQSFLVCQECMNLTNFKAIIWKATLESDAFISGLDMWWCKYWGLNPSVQPFTNFFISCYIFSMGCI